MGFAIDLDQRLLPDELTLPIIPFALLLDVVGRNPLVGVDLWPAIAIAVVVPLGLYLAAIPFGEGSFGLMAGFLRTFTGLLAGLLAAGLVLVVLLAARRIGRRTFIPFGPFLIFGALWGIFVRV